MGTVAFSGAGAPEGSNDAASPLLAPSALGRWARGCAYRRSLSGGGRPGRVVEAGRGGVLRRVDEAPGRELGRDDVDRHAGALLEAGDAGQPRHQVDVPVVRAGVPVRGGVEDDVVR